MAELGLAKKGPDVLRDRGLVREEKFPARFGSHFSMNNPTFFGNRRDASADRIRAHYLRATMNRI